MKKRNLFEVSLLFCTDMLIVFGIDLITMSLGEKITISILKLLIAILSGITVRLICSRFD
jgi:hypothetical protein